VVPAPFPRLLALATLVVLSLAMGLACDPELRAPSQGPGPATPEAVPEPPKTTIGVRLRMLPPEDPTARDTLVAELKAAGFALVSEGADVDVLLTVAPPASGAADPRTTLTLSPTVSGHAMEDISGHYLRAEAPDPVAVREVCRRLKRRYQRFHSAIAREER